MTDLDTTRTVLAQVVASAPVSWETAVFAFAAMAAGVAAKKIGDVEKLGHGIEKKVDIISMLLHGVPEQQGRGGIVHTIQNLEERVHSIERHNRGEN